MHIVQVDLENVKSYARESVTFTPGTNAICGHNGAGKSTILEAIGFALFDALPTTQDQFVREGEKTATVTVHVVSDDGRLFHVVRKCGSYSRYYVYDPEIDQKLTEGKADTMDWLHQFTGVERGGDLSALFEDAVGVSQGLLTADFLETPSRRKDVFNPLLRVDEYEEVWEALRAPARRLEEDINEAERQIAGLEGEVKQLPDLEEEAASLERDIAANEAARDEAQGELEDATEQRDTLKAVKERLDELERAVTAAEGEVKRLKGQLEDARSAFKSAEEAQAVVAETKEGHRAYQTAQETLEELEDRRQERDRLREARQEKDKALALAEQEVARLEDELTAIAEAESEAERLQPQVETQKELEAKLERAERDAERLEDARQELAKERERLTELRDRLAEVEEGLEELGEVEGAIAALKADLEALEEQRDALTAEIAGHEADLARLREQTETLESTEKGKCPVCEGPLTPEHREELLTRNRAQEEELVEVLEDAQAKRDEVAAARREKQEALDEKEARVKELPRPAEAEEVAAQIEGQREAVAEIEATVDELAEAPEKTDQIAEELEALGDPRRAYQRAADIVARRDEVEEALDNAGQQVGELSDEIGELEEELAAYEGLDEKVEAQRETATEHEDAHQRYLAHVREAKALKERRETVATREEDLEAARAERDRLTEKWDQVAAGYDAEAYEELTATCDDLRSEVATLEERVRQQRNRFDDLRDEIEQLKAVEAELDEARAERDELEDLLSLLEYLRQVLRDAGPKVTEALVEVISLQAARLYADIMADHSARLHWTEDYEIILKSNGRERGFQQLSGGEQMAAALAVRLALLKEVSAVDLAFFDEPTANLDARRRDNLAEQILDVKGFSQLFVISHDDTFEQDTDHVVQVVKEDGGSRVIQSS